MLDELDRQASDENTLGGALRRESADALRLRLTLALALLAAEGGQTAGTPSLAYHPAGVVPTLQDLAKGTPATKKQLQFGAGHPAAQQREMV